MKERYSRNRLYVLPEEQDIISQKRILLGGAGIGSIIAECAIRFGFEKMTIVDGDVVEESNLNRQNYCQSDIGKYKAETLAKRLLAINPHAQIAYLNEMITHDNLVGLIEGHDIAINALDFNSDIPFALDEECRKRDIPVLHPYNFGWAGFLTIVSPHGEPITVLSNNPSGFELKMANYLAESQELASEHHRTIWKRSREYATSTAVCRLMDCCRILRECNVSAFDLERSAFLP